MEAEERGVTIELVDTVGGLKMQGGGGGQP
jgi:hypothetical protein